MFLRISLAGHESLWRFRGSSELSAWLRSETWRQSGGVFGVRVRSEKQAAMFAAEFERELTALANGRVDASVLRPSPNETLRSLEDILSEKAGVAPGLRRSEWLALVAQEVSAVEVVYVLDAVRAPGGLSRWREQASALVSELRKSCETAIVTVVILAPSGGVPDAFDFSVGEPLPDLGWLHQASTIAWRAYIHRRIAWESGGDLALASLWVDAPEGHIVEGDDDSLEAWLNARAEEKWEGLPSNVAEALPEYLEGLCVRGGRHSESLLAATAVFEQRRLIWRPQGSPRARLVPWVARALLLRASAPLLSVLLRAELAVPGIVGLAFSRCLELEGWVRAGVRRVGSPDSQTMSLYERYCEGTAPGSAYYVPAFPAPPRDPWWVASFGVVLKGALIPKRVSGRLYELLNLRNSLGHGHPCCWRALMDLRRLEEELG